jgi:excisionase family DNA binding protein
MMLTLSQAAAQLCCSKAHLSNVINGKLLRVPPLPVVRIGRRVLIRQETLQKWLAELEQRGFEMLRLAGLVSRPGGRYDEST